MKIKIVIIALILSISINKYSETKEKIKINIWGTYYSIPKFSSIYKGVTLRDVKGYSLGKDLSLKNWCACAMEGSCNIDNEIFNFVKTTKTFYVDCSSFYNHNPSGYAKFKKVNSEYGLGVKGRPLIPYKSIAVDPKFIPIDSKIYIPEARGVFYEFEGKILEHDGVFYADDVGGLIENNHVDFFIGSVEENSSVKNPFNFIKSNSKKTFIAYLLK
jgi:3D (Asp-Asp-Asp) domain-containing protein